MNIANITKVRGQVVEDFVQIETLITTIITNFYVGRQNPFSFMFSLQVLYDENCSFGMKRNILKKIITLTHPEKEQVKETEREFHKLHKLNKIRNLFAHCGPDIYFAVQGKGRRITPNPQSPTEPIELDRQYVTYKELYPQVFRWLNALLQEIDASRNAGLQRFFDAFTVNASSFSDNVEAPQRAAKEETSKPG